MMQRNQSSFTDPELHPVLTERSIAYLQERAVPFDVAQGARLSSLSSYQIDELLSRENHISSGGLGIPYLGHGEVSWRVRLDEVPAQGKQHRWRWSKGEAVRPYLPPNIPAETWRDPTQELFIVEGPIKALAMWAAGHPCIGLSGVETGHDLAAWQTSKLPRLHAELLARVVWTGRRVTVVFDAGRANNPRVAHGEARICAALRSAGAVPYVAAVPLADGKDQGPDDFLRTQGAEALQEVLTAAQLAHPIDRIQSALATQPRKDVVRHLYGWLEELPFVAALSLGGSLLQDQIAFEVKPHIARKAFTERVSKFQAMLVGKTLAEETNTDVDAVILDMNRKHAVVRQGGNLSILWEEDRRYTADATRRVVDFYAQPQLELYYKNKTVLVDRGAGQPKKEQSVLQYWLRHPQRRTFNEVVFAPGGEPDGAFNLWQGWGAHPRPGDWSLLRNHIWENICSQNEALFKYLIAWMADGVQNPAKRPGTTIILRGKEGTGKGVLVSNYGALFGSHFLQVSNPRHFLGNFNAHLANCLFLFADEAFWAGDKSSDGILKALITEDTLNIERKGQDMFKMPNLIRMMMASNNDWVVPAGMEARRFCVIDVSEARMQDEKYFQAIQEQMANGGKEAFMHDLLHADLEIANLRSVPKTRALLEQKIYSMTPIQQFWYNRLCDGSLNEGTSWSDFVPCAELYALYVKESQLVGEKRRAREIEFGMQLRKLVPSHTRKMRTIERKIFGGGTEQRRVWCYFFPPLAECRAGFATQLGETALDWDEGESVSSEAMHNAAQATQDHTSPAADPSFGF